jgi:hypothetical protein
MRLASSPRETTPKADLEGRYANFFKVGHNAYEFIIDFGQFYADETKQERIHSRIVTSPAYAKGLLKTLQAAIVLHEAEFDIISEPETK